MGKLEGQVAVITGASRGIGQTIAELFGILDISVEHELLIFVAVYLEKSEQTVVAAIQFFEKFAGQTSVQEFKSTSDGTLFL